MNKANRSLVYTIMVLLVLCFVGHEYITIIEIKARRKWDVNNNNNIQRFNRSTLLAEINHNVTLSPKEVYELGIKRLEALRKLMITTPQPFRRKQWGEEYTSYKDEVINKWKQALKVPSKRYKFAIGLSTIKRQGADYLFTTVHSLLDNMRPEDEIVIVIMIGEEDQTYVDIRRKEIITEFSDAFSSGVLQVISPPANFYPDWEESLRQSFGDPFMRVKWRSKQNLDQMIVLNYISLMNIDYYVMMEDDVISVQNYSQKMSKHVDSLVGGEWLVASYCSLGAIGKLIPKEIVLPFNLYIGLFWSDKPLDWLLPNYVESRVCSADRNCMKDDYPKFVKSYKPSLFQHMGKISSLPGKIQKLKDPSFGKTIKT